MILLVFHEKKEEKKENESMNYHIIHMVHNRVSFYRSLHFVALLLWQKAFEDTLKLSCS